MTHKESILVFERIASHHRLPSPGSYKVVRDSVPFGTAGERSWSVTTKGVEGQVTDMYTIAQCYEDDEDETVTYHILPGCPGIAAAARTDLLPKKSFRCLLDALIWILHNALKDSITSQLHDEDYPFSCN